MSFKQPNQHPLSQKMWTRLAAASLALGSFTAHEVHNADPAVAGNLENVYVNDGEYATCKEAVVYNDTNGLIEVNGTPVNHGRSTGVPYGPDGTATVFLVDRDDGSTRSVPVVRDDSLCNTPPATEPTPTTESPVTTQPTTTTEATTTSEATTTTQPTTTTATPTTQKPTPTTRVEVTTTTTLPATTTESQATTTEAAPTTTVVDDWRSTTSTPTNILDQNPEDVLIEVEGGNEVVGAASAQDSLASADQVIPLNEASDTPVSRESATNNQSEQSQDASFYFTVAGLVLAAIAFSVTAAKIAIKGDQQD